jgi:hypothetical protein
LSFTEVFESLKKNKYVWIVYISITIAVNVLFLIIEQCFGQIFVSLATFTIPYLFGVRNLKTFFKAGLFIIILTGIIFGAINTYFMYNQIHNFEQKDLSGGPLKEGTVTPYIGNLSSPFNFTVKYEGEESHSNITIYVNITDYEGKYELVIVLKNANGFYYNETYLSDKLYFYHFSIYLNDTDKWIETNQVSGPITLPFPNMLGVQMFIAVGFLIINGGLLYFLILGLYYWKRNLAQEKIKEKEGNAGN